MSPWLLVFIVYTVSMGGLGMYQSTKEDTTKGLSSREAARGHATNVDGEMLSVTINRIYNY